MLTANVREALIFEPELIQSLASAIPEESAYLMIVLIPILLMVDDDSLIGNNRHHM